MRELRRANENLKTASAYFAAAELDRFIIRSLVAAVGDQSGDVEITVAEYVAWCNHRRIHGELGQRTPAAVEATNRPSHYDQSREPARAR